MEKLYGYRFLHQFKDGDYLLLNLKTGKGEMFRATKRIARTIEYKGVRLRRVEVYNTQNLQAPDYYVNTEDQMRFLKQSLDKLNVF
jgi:hypothetical protein